MHKIHHHLHDFFIPHEGNNHWPHSVRHKHLWTYGGVLLALKAILVALLFITFPTLAEFSTITQARIADLVNQTRAENGQAPLVLNPTLQQAAELKLSDMVSNKYFAHTSPQGVTPWVWFKQAGYVYTYAGENLAMNFTEAEDAHQAWLASATHRANILNSNYQEIGVAVGLAEIDGQTSTIVVQLFGTSFVPPVLVQKPPVQTVQGKETALSPLPRGSAGGVGSEPAIQPLPIPVAPNKEPQVQPEPAIQPTLPVEARLPEIPTVMTQDITGGSQQVRLERQPPSPTIGYILRLVQNFYWLVLGFVILAMLLKILIRVRIQHKKAIAHGLLIIGAGLLLLVLNTHFLEAIQGPVIIF